MRKSAIITGITGQDASYLAELLLEKDYKVYGLKRRTSSNSLGCSDHLEGSVEIVEGDLTDLSSLSRLCTLAQADEFYNLASQSHVGISFKEPIHTSQATGLGVLNCLEAIRMSGYHTKFYQASTSELYGGQRGEFMCDEETPFHPRSPYGVAKAYGHWMTVNYRESYKMFACCGILFNHECVDKYTNLLVKINSTGEIRIVRPKDLMPFLGHESTTDYDQQVDKDRYSIWDGEAWVALRAITVRPVDKSNPDFQGQITNTRNGIVETTRHHKLIDGEGEKRRADTFSLGSSLFHGTFPRLSTYEMKISLEEAELLGLLTGDGWVSKDTNPKIQVSNTDQAIISRVEYLWAVITGNRVSIGEEYVSGYQGTSGITKLLKTASWKLSGTLRKELYNSDGFKKVPDCVLNSSAEVQEAFLVGYNLADGLKANPCTYRYKSFKTNSAHLAQGLLYLVSNVTGQQFNMTYENGTNGNYYSINLLSPVDNKVKEVAVKSLLDAGYSQRAIARETGASRTFVRKIAQGGYAEQHHLRKDPNKVKKIQETKLDYVYDLCTDSGKFMAGVGTMVIGNSPRRGPNFVTRKITLGVAAIKRGEKEKLALGNLDAKRDWGYAKDFVKGMWLMLNHNEPMDFVLATGKTHSVREFCDLAFRHVGLDYQDHVVVDPRFYRPAEVDILLGDPSKAMAVLGWKPALGFEGLVKDMVDHDLQY